MSANNSRGRGRGYGGNFGGQRKCPLVGCENALYGRFNYCSKEHARQAVMNEEVEACERCKIYPKNPGFEYCTRACGGMAAAGVPYEGNSSVTMTYMTLNVNPNASGQYGGQSSAGRGQNQQNQPRGGRGGRGGGGGGSGGAGRGRGRGRSDDDASDRLSVMSGGSVKTTADGGLRTFHFGPCNCSVRTRVTPSTAFCPVCSDPCTSVLVEQNGTFTDFLASDEAIDEEQAAEDEVQPQSQPRASQHQPQSPVQQSPPAVPQAGPSPSAPAIVTPPQSESAIVTPQTSEDGDHQMMERDKNQPPSIMPRVTVRRLPQPPRSPMGPRPPPDHSMEVDLPGEMEVSHAPASGQNDSQPVEGYVIEDAPAPTSRPPFDDESNLPFAQARRPSPLPAPIAVSLTSPLDPFLQPKSPESPEQEDGDLPPVQPAVPTNIPFVPPPPPPPLSANLVPPPSLANPFADPASVQSASVTPEPVVHKVVKENGPSSKSNQAVPGQWSEHDRTAALSRNGAVTANSAVGPYKAAQDLLESSTYGSGPGSGGFTDGVGGFRQPEGGYELRELKQRQQPNQSHSRNGSESGPYGGHPSAQSTEYLVPPSPLLNHYDRPGGSSQLEVPPAPPATTTASTSALKRKPIPNQFNANQKSSMQPNGRTSNSRTIITISEKPNEAHFRLSNFSFTPLEYCPDPNTALEKQYPTPEHLFQAMKFMRTRPLIAEHIQTCGANPKPREEAKRFAYEQDPKWEEVCMDMMYEVLRLKFRTHSDAEAELLDTGEAELVLESTDSLWGCGADGKGQNNLGKLLMQLRQELVQGFSAQIDRTPVQVPGGLPSHYYDID